MDVHSESPDLVMVMPTYNEQECIEEVVKSWSAALYKLVGESHLLLVVNDGSRDATGKILDQLDGQISLLRVIHQENGGHGAAVRRGYEEAVRVGSTFVGQVDSDNQFLPEDFSRLWERRQESPMILGWRKQRHDPMVRKIISSIVRILVFLLSGSRIPDPNIPYRIYRSCYLRELLKVVPPGVFAPNIMLSLQAGRDGVPLLHLPVTHLARATGEVSIKKFKLLKVSLRTFGEILTWRIGLNMQ